MVCCFFADEIPMARLTIPNERHIAKLPRLWPPSAVFLLHLRAHWTHQHILFVVPRSTLTEFINIYLRLRSPTRPAPGYAWASR